MTNELKSFLQANMQLISENDFRTLYNKFSEKHEIVSDLTEVLLAADIDPLMYLPEVPASYAYAIKTLKQIYIPDHIDRILQFAFLGCKNLTHVTLPASIKLISKNAFSTSGCNLTVRYQKSSKEFAELDMMFNSFLPGTIIQCTDKTGTFMELTDDVWDWSKI